MPMIKKGISKGEHKALLAYLVDECIESLSIMTTKNATKAEIQSQLGVLKNNMTIVKEVVEEL